MKWTAYIDDDGAIIIRGRSEYLDGQDGRPLGEGPLERIRPGDELMGQPFAYWTAFLEERGGAADIEMVSDHLNPPDFPCPPEGCPRHPRDDYDDMARQVEHWRNLLGTRDHARRVGHGQV